MIPIPATVTKEVAVRTADAETQRKILNRLKRARGQLDAVIREVEGVAEAAVIGVADEQTGESVVAYVVAPGLDPASLLAGDVMSDDLLTASASDDVHETIEHMRLRGIRRVPVVDADGKLAGIVSADDLLEFLAAEMSELSRIGSWQQSHERRVRQ